MIKEIVLAELKSIYPDKTILQLPQDDPREIVCEIEPSSISPERSVAIAVIDESHPHVHNKSVETYEVSRGEVSLFVGEQRVLLTEGESYLI